MGLIKIDYYQALREANRLRSVANQCQTNNGLIDRLIRLVPTYWQGEAAQAFIDELNQLKNENNNIRSEASNLASTVKRVADEIREAELRAMAAIKNS